MKQFLIMCSLLLSAAAIAQPTAKLTINNVNNPCDIKIVMYGTSASFGSTTCDDIYGGFISILAGTSVTYNDPTFFEAACVTPSGAWASMPGGASTLGGSVPSDFQWTRIVVDYMTCPTMPPSCNLWSMNIGDGTILCSGIGGSSAGPVFGTPVNWCSYPISGHAGSWVPISGTSLSNVTVTVR